MKKSQHTPWEIREDPTEYSLKAIAGKYEYEPNEFASVWIARELTEDNAKLISVLPELLEALTNHEMTMCLKEWEILPKNSNGYKAWTKIQSAIKKATE